MWHSLLKAEPAEPPSLWGGTIKDWAKGNAKLPTGYDLEELQTYWAENEKRDFSAQSGASLQKIITLIKEQINDAPDTVEGLAGNFVEQLIKAGKTKADIKRILPQLERLVKSLVPTNKYHDISIGSTTLASLNLASIKNPIDKWLVLVLNKLYAKFINSDTSNEDETFRNLQWLLLLVAEMRKEKKKYGGVGAIFELIKNKTTKDKFIKAFSDWQSNPDIPSYLINDIKSGFDLKAKTSAERVSVPTRRNKDITTVTDVEGVTTTTERDKTKRVTMATPSKSLQGLSEPEEIKLMRVAVDSYVEKYFNEGRDELVNKIGMADYRKFRGIFNGIKNRLALDLAALQQNVGDTIYPIVDNFNHELIGMSKKAFNELMDDLINTNVHTQLMGLNSNHPPLAWFSGKSWNIVHSLSLGDASTQEITSRYSPIDNISKNLTSVRESRKQHQTNFVEEYIQEKIKDDRAYLSTDDGEDYTIEEKIKQVSKKLSEGDDSDLNEEWHRFLNKEANKGEYSEAQLEMLSSEEIESKLQGGKMVEVDKDERQLTSDEVIQAFNLDSHGLFIRNYFLAMFFHHYSAVSSDIVELEVVDSSIAELSESGEQEWHKNFSEIQNAILRGQASQDDEYGTLAQFKFTGAKFESSTMESFMKITGMLMRYVKIWQGNEEAEKLRKIGDRAIRKFHLNITDAIQSMLEKGEHHTRESKQMIIQTALDEHGEADVAPFFREAATLFGALDDLKRLEAGINGEIKKIAVTTLPTYFHTLIEKIGNNQIKPPHKQKLGRAGNKITLKEKLLKIGLLKVE